MRFLNLSSFTNSIALLCLCLFLGCAEKPKETGGKAELKLWYDRPAEIWEEALPVGNGSLGAMVFGRPVTERIQFNEDTFWAGGPITPSKPETKSYLPEVRKLVFDGKYKEADALINKHIIGPKMMPYLPMGDVVIEMKGLDDITDFRRELDLRTAISKVGFSSKGIAYKREVFSAVEENAIVIRLEASKEKSLNFSIALDNQIGATSRVLDANNLELSGTAPDRANRKSELRFVSRLNIGENDGHTIINDSTITVSGASKVTLLLFAATNFKNYKDVSGNPNFKCKTLLDLVHLKSFEQIREQHITNHQRLFERLDFDMPTNLNSGLPTNERLQKFQEETDPSLVALYYQFGRYLLMSSSRGNSQPARLRAYGIKIRPPPWDSKYTTNINLEMNYWRAEASNLAECAIPLFTSIRQLAEAGAVTAKNNYGADGWVLHHNTDIWKTTTPLDGAAWGIWPIGGAWLTTHLWEHYLFSEDEAFLRLHYPVIKGAAQFFVNTLVAHPEYGYLVTNLSISPENRHMEGNISVCAGPAMDTQLLRDLFAQCIKASEILNVDSDFRELLVETRSKLAPDKIGSEGQLQEWLDDWDMKVPELQHRHVSHLYGLYPGAQFTPEKTPKEWNATRKSLEIRGDGGTGWSLGWKVALWARLNDGDHAFKILKTLLKPTDFVGHGGPGGTYPNLFNALPSFSNRRELWSPCRNQ
ncbi:glycoside hydrolase family 95 protein [Zobellia nedashkovskayae]